MAESRKIISIIPASPGWRVEYDSEKTVSYLAPVACWALVHMLNDEGEVFSTEVVPVTPGQVSDSGETMWIGGWDVDGAFEMIGVVGPDEEYTRQSMHDAAYRLREEARMAEERAKALAERG